MKPISFWLTVTEGKRIEGEEETVWGIKSGKEDDFGHRRARELGKNERAKEAGRLDGGRNGTNMQYNMGKMI